MDIGHASDKDVHDGWYNDESGDGDCGGINCLRCKPATIKAPDLAKRFGKNAILSRELTGDENENATHHKLRQRQYRCPGRIKIHAQGLIDRNFQSCGLWPATKYQNHRKACCAEQENETGDAGQGGRDLRPFNKTEHLRAGESQLCTEAEILCRDCVKPCEQQADPHGHIEKNMGKQNS